MDILRQMTANRQAAGIVIQDTKPTSVKKDDKPPAGTKSMRAYIIENKVGKKHVKEHFEAIISQECESSDDSD